MDILVERLIREHGQAMYRVAFGVVHDHGLAEDVVQESLVRAWLAIDTFRGEGSLRAWLLRIAHNTAVSTLRQRRDLPYGPTPMQEGADAAAQGRIEAVGLRLALDATLGELDQKSRTIVVLRDVEGCSYDEIAHIVGVTVSVVKSRLFRARRQLADALREVKE